MASYILQYRTFDQLLAEVQSDFKSFNLEGLINPQDFIKVAKRCNYELGLKLFKTKEALLDVENGRAKLPNQFYVLNFAFVVSSHSVTQPVISGTHVESIPAGVLYNPGPNEVVLCADPVVTPSPNACNRCSRSILNCSCESTCNVTMNCKGEEMILIQKLKYETRSWSQFHRIKLVNDSNFVDSDCPNLKWQSSNSAYIKNGFIYPSFKTGKIYVNFQGMMEDDEGNLLVPDHDLLNEFYEYAIKQRLLENLIMNGETVSQSQIQIIEQRLRAARNNAYSLVRTPDFGELKKIWETNRKAQFHKYYSMFKSH